MKDNALEVIDKYDNGLEVWTIFRQVRNGLLYAIKSDGCGYHNIGDTLDWDLEHKTNYKGYRVILAEQMWNETYECVGYRNIDDRT